MKLSLAFGASTCALVWIASVPLLIEHFANAAEKAAEDSTSAWVSASMLDTEIMLLDLA